MPAAFSRRRARPVLIALLSLLLVGGLGLGPGCGREVTFGPAGDPVGTETLARLRLTLETDAAHAPAARAYAAQFASLGLKIEIEIRPWDDLVRRAAAGEGDAYLIGWSGPSPDPLGLVAAKLGPGGDGNLSGYSNSELARLLTGLLSRPTVPEREKCARAAQEFLFEEAPWVYGVGVPLLDASTPALSGWRPGPAGAVSLHDATLASPGGRAVVGLGLGEWPDLDPLRPIDPQAATVFRCLFDALCTLGPDGALLPELAASWEFAADGRRLVVRLREGVLFHDGEPLRPADVVYTYEKVLPGRLPEGVEVRINAIEKDSVVFSFSAPFPRFLELHGLQPIVPAKVAAIGTEAFAAAPVGTGPFRLDPRQSGRQVVLVRWDRYYGGCPALEPCGPAKLDEVAFVPLPDLARRVAMLGSGQIMLAPALGPEAAEALQAFPELRLVREPGWTVLAVELNNRRPPFDDARVRLALNFGLDREALALALGPGAGILPTAFLPEGFGFWAEAGSFGYEPERARSLLGDAGYLTPTPGGP